MSKIIGCDHNHQRRERRCFTTDQRLLDFEDDQKRRFVEVLDQAQRESRATLICEEIDQGCDTFARELAHQRRVGYVNVDMPLEERQRRQIPLDYGQNGAPYTREQVEVWHAAREQFMVQRLLDARQDDEVVVLICGRTHQHRLAELLRRHGIECEVVDLADFDWFSDDWVQDYPMLD